MLGPESCRKHRRHPVVLSIVYQRTDAEETWRGVGWTRNLSEGGACLELGEALPQGATLRVALQADQSRLWMDAEVVWAGRAGEVTDGIPHGIAFVQVTGEQAKALGGLVGRLGRLRGVAVRVPLRCPVACRVAGESIPPLQGQTGDISRRGLSVSLPGRLPEASEIEVTLPTREGPLTVRATVVWVDPAGGKPDEGVHHGLEFGRLNWEDEVSLGLLVAEGGEDPPDSQERAGG